MVCTAIAMSCAILMSQASSVRLGLINNASLRVLALYLVSCGGLVSQNSVWSEMGFHH